MVDASSLTLREALDLVDPREAYFDLLVGKADWVALSAAVQSAEFQLGEAEEVKDPKRREAATKVARQALEDAKAAYEPHVKRVWFEPALDYEALSLQHKLPDLYFVLMERCARVPDDQRLTAAEWEAFVSRWPAADRTRLCNTLLYLNIELTVPDLGKGFSPIR